MVNMKHFSIGLIGILLIVGFTAISNAYSSPNPTESIEPYDLLIHYIYPYYTYDELLDGTIMVSGQIISISESKWSTLDGKKPEGMVATEKTDENGKPYTELKIARKDEEYIYTDAILKINTDYSGNLKEDEIVIRFFTGTADNWRMTDEPGLDIRYYEEGENYLFFLGQHITPDGEKVPNHYCIITPRGALKEQQSSSPNVRSLMSNLQESFVNFDGEQLNPETFLLDPIAPIEYTELDNPRYNPEFGGANVPYELLITENYSLYTQKELRKNSDLVISGKVLSISESRWSTSDGQQPKDVSITKRFDENGEPSIDFAGHLDENEYIYTDMDLQVDMVYNHRGEINTEIITVRLPSGTVEELTMANQGGLDVRNYNEGDEVFLFLKYTFEEGEADGWYYLSTPQCALMKQ